MLATQPSAMPTNKTLTMSAGFLGLSTFVGPFVQEVWPQLVPLAWSGPATTEFVSNVLVVFLSLAVTWFVPDRLNQLPS